CDSFHHLTVVTNGLHVFNVLAQKEGFDLVLCGGHYAGSETAFCGQQTLESLRSLRVQKAFVCPSALSLKDGVCDYSFDMQPIQKQMIACAEEVFFLADSNKFEKRAMLKLAEMSPHYTYVTDSGLNPDYKRLYEENNLQIITNPI
ncbi:MAG: DeoR/GlpR transcriptional regulator, partial [Clostridia bacterium]|nr:DeoR/GlpR transcriptional regulator [Clostridia bacterium]